MTDVQIILPPKDENAISEGLVKITEAIEAVNPDVVAHGFLGGPCGYGARFENQVFWMVPDYMDAECNCGHGEEAEHWHEEHQHTDACYQTELRARLEAYKAESGFNEIELRAFGPDKSLFSGMDVEHTEEEVAPGVTVHGVIGTPRQDATMEAWRKAYDALRKFEDRLYADLCRKYKLPKRGCAVHCTCYREKAAEEWFAKHDHAPMCPVVWPNFRHKASGFEVRWYKYIGRSQETKGSCDWDAVVAECIASVRK